MSDVSTTTAKPKAKAATGELPKFEIPRFEMPKFEIPKMEVPAAFREFAEKMSYNQRIEVVEYDRAVERLGLER